MPLSHAGDDVAADEPLMNRMPAPLCAAYKLPAASAARPAKFANEAAVPTPFTVAVPPLPANVVTSERHGGPLPRLDDRDGDARRDADDDGDARDNDRDAERDRDGEAERDRDRDGETRDASRDCEALREAKRVGERLGDALRDRDGERLGSALRDRDRDRDWDRDGETRDASRDCEALREAKRDGERLGDALRDRDGERLGSALRDRDRDRDWDRDGETRDANLDCEALREAKRDGERLGDALRDRDALAVFDCGASGSAWQQALAVPGAQLSLKPSPTGYTWTKFSPAPLLLGSPGPHQSASFCRDRQ
jgi:hypothetical protein